LKRAINKIKNLFGFGNGHERTNRAKRNITATFLIKGVNIALSLLLVPLMIHYLNPTKYGIWITLTSLVAWFGFFDIGLGNGLRNRFAEALAKGDHRLAKTYVSTTYAILIIIISVVLILFYVINSFLDWGVILNTGNDPLLKKELSRLALVVFTTFGFTFVLNLISVILSADQHPAKSSMFDLIGKSLSLLFIFILTRVSKSSLLSLGVIYCSLSPLVLAISTIWFFTGKYRPYHPSYKSVDFSKAKDLFSLGIKFFLIQIGAVILYQTNNMIIAQLFGPAMVTPYNVAFKYFTILMICFMIIVGPFWSAFTEAWVKHDIEWVRNIMKKLMQIWFVIVLCGFIMLLSSKVVFRIWIGKNFAVPFSISFLTLCWILINAWNGIFSQFLNGLGKIKIQLILGVSLALINIPLAIFLGKIMGINGILLSNIIVSLFTVIIYPIQYKKLLNGTAHGLFNS
jgi:O-antigen/teichoic acid export membrane protein